MTTDFYEKKLIAFVDILGWSDASKDQSQYGRLRTTVQKIEDYAKKFSVEIKQYLRDAPGTSKTLIKEHASIEFSFFSDCFAVSAPIDYGKKIFEILSWASHELLRENFLIRGGVTIGDLVHCKGIIFGPALVEAVRLEKKEAVYPCLLCGGEELEQYLKRMDCKKIVMRDRDQKLVVNIALGNLFAKGDQMEIINKKLTEFLKKYETIDKSSKEFTDLKKVETKWKYLQEMLPKMYEDRAIKY